MVSDFEKKGLHPNDALLLLTANGRSLSDNIRYFRHMCLHSSPGNDKSRHSKQVTASPKSNILLCLKSKGFEFLSAIHLSLMKHPL